ncbi:hypothetical protein LG307_03040 [Sutcliffiella horikoshii]|uniref:hypothetical protein n=1 Tax=Sutcliffiella horikoshii TaxID=79883 RepID=UPI0038504EBE
MPDEVGELLSVERKDARSIIWHPLKRIEKDCKILWSLQRKLEVVGLLSTCTKLFLAL